MTKGFKFSKEAIAKRLATREAKKAAKAAMIANAQTNVPDALIFLNKAVKLIRANGKELGDLELYVLMAKRTLEGGLK